MGRAVVSQAGLLLFLCVIAACSRTQRSSPDTGTELRSETVENRSVADEVASAPPCSTVAPQVEGAPGVGEIGYEIFVRSFQDSNGDGIGDLDGILQRLDYLNDGDPDTTSDLGITLLWLMPTFPSPSYHGYDVTDYRGVNSQYGTLEELEELVHQAHERGIKVILDLVMNHSSNQHPWFLDAATTSGEHRNWYVWREEFVHWGQPWNAQGETWHSSGDSFYYGLFWSGMPDLNYENPAVVAAMKEAGRFWLQEVGIDGYRLDAVRYLVEAGDGEGMQDQPATLSLWKEFAADWRQQKSDVILIGEAWASNAVASQYRGEGEGLGLTFDFDLMEAIVSGIIAQDAQDIEGVLTRFCSQFPEGSGDATFLSNHDLVRLSSRLLENRASLELAAQLLMTLPGTPFVYYGQEIGMINGPQLKDEHKRLPMQWEDSENGGFTTGTPWIPLAGNQAQVNVATQTADPESLLSLYRDLIRLRRNHPELARGGFAPVRATSKTQDDLWAFQRCLAATCVLVVVNLTETAALEASVAAGVDWAEASPEMLWPSDEVVSLSQDRLALGDVGPQSIKIVHLELK